MFKEHNDTISRYQQYNVLDDFFANKRSILAMAYIASQAIHMSNGCITQLMRGSFVINTFIRK